MIAGLERRAGLFDDSIAAWQKQAEDARKRQSGVKDVEEIRGLGRLVEEWSRAPEIGTMSPGEFDELVSHAMSSPGIVLSRAIGRYWDWVAERASLDYLLAASWQGLRTYFDQRWFAAAIGRGERDYVRQLQQAIIDGNLESVLDEWFWLLTAAHGYSGSKLCEEIVSVAKLRGSDVHFHSLESKSKSFSIRAHSALPFVDVRYQGLDADASSAPLRNDALRQAFNSPFFPHVLTTTSVGQEGLDFHAWCRTIVHWDLAPDAADLEQREGRIQRFAGLAVRRAIAGKCGSAERTAVGGQSESPWRHLADLAEKEMGDSSGLAPWWVCEGAKIDRCVFDVPTSQDRARLNDLRAQRGLYRVVLGQPHQEDLMAVLQRHHLEGRTVPPDLLPRLSPYFKR